MANKRATIPRTRTIKEGGRVKRVPFNPERAATLLEMRSHDHIFESVAFWIARLVSLTCPACNRQGTLELEIGRYDVDIECCKCGYVREVQFTERT